MNPSKDDEARLRLGQLEAFLRQDPDNGHLLVEAFDAAMQAGEWERAEFHVRHALALGRETVAWQLRHIHWCMGQSRWDEADAALTRLRSDSADRPERLPTIDQDLAAVAFARQDYAEACRRLAPYLESPAGSTARVETSPSVQVLWLRSLHRTGELRRACDWAGAAEAEGRLDPQAAGVASLAALDLDELPASKRWSEAALQHVPGQLEAMVARASLALADQDARQATELLHGALQVHPRDGRAWSALGLANLLSNDRAGAIRSFGQALQFMPGHIGTWHGLAWTQLVLNDTSGAKASFETALRLDRNFAENHGGLAVVLAVIGQTDAAREHITRALKLDASCVSARYAQALLDGEARDPQAVQRLAQRLLGARMPSAIVGKD